jgi:hypothetical protein
LTDEARISDGVIRILSSDVSFRKLRQRSSLCRTNEEGVLYGDAAATLWLTGPAGAEMPAVWADGSPGNEFAYDEGAGEYLFAADLTWLSAGLWTARMQLDDGNDYTVTFVVPGA